MNKIYKASEILNTEIGEEGSEKREKFKEEAYSYYLSEILKTRRKQLKLSQQELANIVGKKRPYISRVENGEDVRLSNFLQIASALGLNFELRPNQKSQGAKYFKNKKNKRGMPFEQSTKVQFVELKDSLAKKIG